MPHGLDRRVLRVTLNVAEMLGVEARAREAGLSVNNYVRTRVGLTERSVGNLSEDERHREEDDAWERLERLGLNPRDYLPHY